MTHYGDFAPLSPRPAAPLIAARSADMWGRSFGAYVPTAVARRVGVPLNLRSGIGWHLAIGFAWVLWVRVVEIKLKFAIQRRRAGRGKFRQPRGGRCFLFLRNGRVIWRRRLRRLYLKALRERGCCNRHDRHGKNRRQNLHCRPIAHLGTDAIVLRNRRANHKCKLSRRTARLGRGRAERADAAGHCHLRLQRIGLKQAPLSIARGNRHQ